MYRMGLVCHLSCNTNLVLQVLLGPVQVQVLLVQVQVQVLLVLVKAEAGRALVKVQVLLVLVKAEAGRARAKAKAKVLAQDNSSTVLLSSYSYKACCNILHRTITLHRLVLEHLELHTRLVSLLKHLSRAFVLQHTLDPPTYMVE